MSDFILIGTCFKALEKFGKNSEFNKDEPDLNRHWIMHGRTDHCMEQIDCIRVINIFYGTILLGKWERLICKDTFRYIGIATFSVLLQ